MRHLLIILLYLDRLTHPDRDRGRIQDRREYCLWRGNTLHVYLLYFAMPEFANKQIFYSTDQSIPAILFLFCTDEYTTNRTSLTSLSLVWC